MVLEVQLKILLIVLFHFLDFDNFKLPGQLFAKTLQSLEACVLVNNNLCGKLVSSLELPIVFDERFQVMSVLFFIPNFNLLSFELGNFTLKMLHLFNLY